MSQKIKDALAKLDATNDNHWTADGLPRLDTVKLLVGDSGLSREQVTTAQPGFSRASALQAGNASVPALVPQAAPQPETVVTPAPVAQLPAATELVAVELTEVEKLQMQLAGANEALVVYRIARDEATKAFNKQQQVVDELTLQLQKALPPDTNANAVQSYHAQQRAILQERARRIQATKGLNLQDYLPKRAPIDVAMARKNQRGTGRPGS